MAANISIFVPHLGCPNKCSFCNQHYIAGEFDLLNKDYIDKAVAIAKKSKKYNPEDTEIAFFGGSFTAIDREYMIELLSWAAPYVEDGSVKGIRISTRPDAIDEDILEILKSYKVTSIELGAQSMDNKVLLANNRGHTAEDVVNASKIIKKFGFSLGLQMMTGLYESSDSIDIDTAKKLVELNPDTVRIYPTIVLENTNLAELYKSGIYKPQELEAAINLTIEILALFEKNNINVIRTGLHTINNEKFVAGPWHPAFCELCQSRIYFEKILSKLENKGRYNVFVNSKEISKAVGQHKENIKKLKNMGYDVTVYGDINIIPLDIKIQRK